MIANHHRVLSVPRAYKFSATEANIRIGTQKLKRVWNNSIKYGNLIWPRLQKLKKYELGLVKIKNTFNS